MIAYERRGMSLTYLEMGENEWWNTTERLETVGSSPSSNRLGSEASIIKCTHFCDNGTNTTLINLSARKPIQGDGFGSARVIDSIGSMVFVIVHDFDLIGDPTK